MLAKSAEPTAVQSRLDGLWSTSDTVAQQQVAPSAAAPLIFQMALEVGLRSPDAAEMLVDVVYSMK